MKVLQILPSLEVGGVERGVLDLVKAMKKRGDDALVISSGGSMVTELEKAGIAHIRMPVQRKSLFSLFLIPKIAEIVRRERVDVIHARSRVPAWLAYFVSRKTGVPLVTTCHGYYSNHFLSRVMGWGKRVIVISNVVGRHMIDDFGVSPDRIRLIHRGIDLTQFPFHPEHYDVPRKSYRIINVARLSPIKGQVEFLKAVHLLRRRLQHIEVWLVGAEGKRKHKYTDEIHSTIQQLGLESSVKLLGTRRDIAELIAQSDLLVLSTLVPEAFGRVIIEAGAVGTAALATRVGGVLDIVDDGENGVLVPAGDPEAMAEAMQSLLTDPKRAKEFALRLRKKIESHFTLDQMVDRTLGVYLEVKRKKKILMIKLGAAGDLILAVPSFRMIRERHPEAEIHLLVDKKLALLVSGCPYLNRIVPVDRAKLSRLPFLLKLAKKIRYESYDISVDLQNSKWTHLLSFLGGVTERFGFARGLLGFLLNRPDHTIQKKDAPVRHQYRILSRLGVKEMDETLELWPDAASEERISRLLGTDENFPRKFSVGLVVGSSVNWPTKRWPAEYFNSLTNKILEQTDSRVILIGAGSDLLLAEAIQVPDNSRFLNMAGKTDLQGLAALMKHVDILVSGDTAPLHVGAAMQSKIIALFGPTDSGRHMPPARGAIVIQKHLACQPCYSGQCKNAEALACLKHITVDEVLDAVKKHLRSLEISGKNSETPQPSPPLGIPS